MPKHDGNQGGAKAGNSHAAKQRVWTNAILRALDNRGKDRNEALDDLAENLLRLCDTLDMTAIKELGDRLEGKPIQAISGLGEDGEHIVSVTVKYQGG